ncbi:MAG: ABC transporter permease [Ardenticatenaceae bacterium]
MVKWQPSPILIKEMRSTMRGRRTFIAITSFLVFLAGLNMLVYYTVAQDMSVSRGGSAEAGRMLFGFLSGIELLLLVTMTPPLTSGAIAGERQRQTFDMLMATPLTPRQVLSGKLLASMNYLYLLIFASLPINAIVFLYGGVSPSALLWWLGLTITVLFMLGTLGLLMSTILRSGGAATALTYIVSMILFLILPVSSSIMLGVLDQWGEFSRCIVTSIWLLHPAGSLVSIWVNEKEFQIMALLPATLPLYSAFAGLFFLVAERRLSALIGQPTRRPFLILALLLVIAIATTYIIAFPVQEMCNS